jgi:molecular chaperone DnaK
MGLIVGIDLGTSTSEISVFRNGKPEFVRDIRQSRHGILPSVVSVGRLGELIVGEQAARDPGAVREIKRHMGEEHAEHLGDREYRPEEIAARILRHLKENAERVYADEVTEAVITVPASFKDPQRRATEDAAELAGIHVERTINEPTAAALAYGIDKLNENQKVVVYDLGGGTLDVTVLELVSGVLEVKASAGDRKLGGTDFDQELMRLIAAEIEREHGISVDLDPDGQDKKTYWQLKEHAERAKIDLSSSDAVSIDIPLLGDRSLGLHMVLTRREFDIATRSLVHRTGEWITKALKDAGLKPDDIDSVLMVGGSTRIPAIRQFVSEHFGGRDLPEKVPPDEAVALGASISAALKAGEIDPAHGLIVTDVTSHSLGVSILEVVGGVPVPHRMSVLIERQSTVPIRRSHRYATVFENQDAVDIRVFQGESANTENNDFLGDFELQGVPPGPAGSQPIDIDFDLDINGVLHVQGTIASTGESKSVVIKPDARRLSAPEKDVAKQQLEEQWKRSRFLNKVEPVLAAAKRAKVGLGGEDLVRVEAIEERLKEALAAEDEAAVDQLDQELTDVLFDLQ